MKKNLQLLLIALIMQKCCSEFSPVFQHSHPLSAPLVPACSPTKYYTPPADQETVAENVTAVQGAIKSNLTFLLPFLDVQIKYDHTVHVIQEQDGQQVYILHGCDLYQLFVERQEERLSWMASLEGSVGHLEAVGAEIMNWQENLVLVIAFGESLDVYQLDENILSQRAANVSDPARTQEPPPIFEPIQQLSLTGRFQKLFLFSPSEEHLMIAVAVNFTKQYAKLRIFEWFSTYFDPVEELTVPGMQMVNIIGSRTKYLITGRMIKQQPKTILTVYEISPISTTLSLIQTLTVQSRVVHIFSYLRRNMIVACSSEQQNCNSYRQMPDGHFAVYRQRTPKQFAFDHLMSSSRFIAASRQNLIMVFTSHRLDCFSSFVSVHNDIPTGLMGLRNINKEIYLLLIYKKPLEILVRLVGLELDFDDLSGEATPDSEEAVIADHHQHLFEKAVGQLRSLLLHRKVDMDKIRKLSQVFKPKLKDVEAKDRITLNGGSVGAIKVVSEFLLSPRQVMEKIESLRQEYLPQRSKRSENQRLLNETADATNRATVKRMKVENLSFQGDVLQGFSLNGTNSSNKILNVGTKSSTRFLSASEWIWTQDMRKSRQQTVPTLKFHLVPSTRIKHLKVDFVNGQPWNAFYESLFLKSRDTVIEGNLIFQLSARIEHLTTTIINGLIVSNLFNLRHPQIIHSELIFSRFFVNDVKASTINGLNFEHDIVFSGIDSFIETPVIINDLRITGDMFLARDTNIEERSDTDEIEFEQFYTNKVVINGSLFVNSLKGLSNEVNIVLEDDVFNVNEIEKKYLLKERAQNFSFAVAFHAGKVAAPSLETVYLNGHPTERHMLVNKLKSRNSALLVFMNAHVKGDVTLRDYKSRLAEIKENIIRLGDEVHLTGRKVFEAPLEVNNAKALTLNGLPAKDLIFKHRLKVSDSVRFGDVKAFSKIKVKEAASVGKQLRALYLNNSPLDDLLKNDFYMDRLKVDHMVYTTNLVFHKINGIPFGEFFTKLNVTNGRLVLNKELIVEGNVQIEHPLNVAFINGINWDEYVNNIVRINEDAVIEGEVCFSGDLTITNALETPKINGYDLENILKNVLMKSQFQLITGNYHFDYVRAYNIDVFYINNADVGSFMDLSKDLTEIESDVVVENLYVGGNVQVHKRGLEFLLLVKEKIQQLAYSPWKSLYVLSDATWSLNVADNRQQQLLKYFYKSAVLANREQVISGNVKMSYPIIDRMQTRFKFPLNLDLEFIQKDALLKNSPAKQTIKVQKMFLSSLYLETLKVGGNVDTKLLNSVDILRFNQSLYYATAAWLLKGPVKFLKPLAINHLITNGVVNGLHISGIYQLGPNSTLPGVQVQELGVENNFTIANINDMNWDYFLNNRVTIRGATLEHFGVLTFENLVIEEKALIKSINGIPIDNLLFKHSPNLQTITGHKDIQKGLLLSGPAYVVHINDKDLMAQYRNSLLKSRDYKFANLVLEWAGFERGLQLLYNVDHNLQQRSFSENDLKFLKFLNEFKVNLNSSDIDIIYLDYDLKASVKWLNPEEHILANQTVYHELSRASSCEKRYIQISFLQPNRIYLKNSTNQNLMQSRNKTFIKAENYCLHPQREEKSKVTIKSPELFKVLSLKHFIETLYIIDNVFNSLDKFVILHVLDLPDLKKNEVRIFRIFSESKGGMHDWQVLKQNIGIQLKHFQLSQMHILLTNGVVDHRPAVTVYHLQNHTQLFKVQQVIDGEFDIIEMLEMPKNQATTQLILSCSKRKRVFIYESDFSKQEPKYEIQQIIRLKSAVEKLVVFNIRKSLYMLVISQPGSGSFNIYKYSYIQGWSPLAFGYFPDLQLSIPVTELWSRQNDGWELTEVSGGLPLMILCQPINCYVVKAFS